ncbi:MAG TPA: CocE/NonD family hydrolase, partial [Thermoanaerobaculia bacterium]|nr:CocE/NonD family hydrolase [Thermoanaerobaculia bacterium]
MRSLITVLIAGLLALSRLGAQEPPLELRIPMRDGIKLSATVWRPAGAGRVPIILIRSPYPRTCCTIPALAAFYVENGYAVVSQDVRGRGDSEGQFGFWFQEVDDGYDTIEWLAAQPWSNGRIGMMGASYPGGAQWLAARAHPPHLTCIVPTSTGGDYFRDFPYMGGAFMEWQALSWVDSMTPRPPAEAAGKHDIDIQAMIDYRPLATADKALTGRTLPLYQDLLAHSTLDDYWKRITFEPAILAHLDLPVLHVTGWYDWAQGSELFLWNGMRRFSPAADRQTLIVGAWTHEYAFFGGASKVGIWDVPPQAILDMKAVHLAFFNRYLKLDASAAAMPRVRLFVTGADEWRTFDDYPVPGVKSRPFYLHSGGHANSASGDGTLSTKPPGKEKADQYSFDPNPKDKRQAWIADPEVERSPKEARSDVLIYTGPILAAPLEVI